MALIIAKSKFYIPGIPEFEENEERDVDDNLSAILIERGLVDVANNQSFNFNQHNYIPYE